MAEAVHEIEIRVRYQETDGQRRLHHANYLTYFEMGRTEMLRACGRTYREFEAEGLFMSAPPETATLPDTTRHRHVPQRPCPACCLRPPCSRR